MDALDERPPRSLRSLPPEGAPSALRAAARALTPVRCKSFAERLSAWQRTHGRHDLPWQGTRDPYRIWLSEIMLQQSQVTTVLPYYGRFLAAFPDVGALAAAPIDRVRVAGNSLELVD